MQLTRTNDVFSRISLVSRFCAENQLLGKTLEIIAKSLFYPKIHGARIRDREGQGGAHTTGLHGGQMAAPPHGVEASGTPSRPPLDYITPFDLKTLEEIETFHETLTELHRHRKHSSEGQKLRSGAQPGWGIGGDRHHHHHQCFSIDHPCFPHL